MATLRSAAILILAASACLSAHAADQPDRSPSVTFGALDGDSLIVCEDVSYEVAFPRSAGAAVGFIDIPLAPRSDESARAKRFFYLFFSLGGISEGAPVRWRIAQDNFWLMNVNKPVNQRGCNLFVCPRVSLRAFYESRANRITRHDEPQARRLHLEQEGRPGAVVREEYVVKRYSKPSPRYGTDFPGLPRLCDDTPVDELIFGADFSAFGEPRLLYDVVPVGPGDALVFCQTLGEMHVWKYRRLPSADFTRVAGEEWIYQHRIQAAFEEPFWAIPSASSYQFVTASGKCFEWRFDAGREMLESLKMGQDPIRAFVQRVEDQAVFAFTEEHLFQIETMPTRIRTDIQWSKDDSGRVTIDTLRSCGRAIRQAFGK